MSTFLGFLELLVWAACVLALSSAITYGVIKLSMKRDAAKEATANAANGSSG